MVHFIVVYSLWSAVQKDENHGVRARASLQPCVRESRPVTSRDVLFHVATFFTIWVTGLSLTREQAHAVSGGMAQATAVRVAFHLGRRDPAAARQATISAAVAGALWGVAVAAVGVAGSGRAARIFSPDDAVLKHAAQVVQENRNAAPVVQWCDAPPDFRHPSDQIMREA